MELINTSETISEKGNEVTVFSSRGGIITSVKIKGIELLYQDMYEETLLNSSKSVKGGIPYMFPNAGPLTPEEKEESGIDLPQHGFGRTNKWTKVESEKSDEYIQELDFEQSEGFAFQGKVKNTTKLGENGVKIIHDIENTSTNNMPIAHGLHPYFRVPEGKKEDIKFNFQGGEIVEDDVHIWSDDGTITFENPGVPFDVEIPGLGTLTIEVSPEYGKFWVWSLPGKDFVCIEPVMGDEGKIANNPVFIKPGETNSNFMKISLNTD